MANVLQAIPPLTWDMNPNSLGGTVQTVGSINLNGTLAGSTIVVCFGCNSGVATTTSTVVSVTDNMGNVYSLVSGTNFDLANKFPGCAFYQATNVAAHTSVVSITASETDNSTIPSVQGHIGVWEIAVASSPTFHGGRAQNLSQQTSLTVTVNDSFTNAIGTTSQTGFNSGVFDSHYSMAVVDVFDATGGDVFLCLNVVAGGAFMVPPMGTLPTVTSPWSYGFVGSTPPLPGNSANFASFGPGSNPLAAFCNNPPAGFVNVPYSHTFEATGGIPPYTWSLLSGTLPTGLSLASTGLLSGTPTVVGTFTFTVQVEDSTTVTANVTCSITISQFVTYMEFRGVKRYPQEICEPA